MKDLKHLIYFENLLQEANNELVQQARAEGEHALGYTCYFVPETLLNLPGCFSSRLRAPNTGSIDVGTYYMSSKICSYTRSILERGIEGGYDYLDALLSSETCQMMHRGHEHFEILGLVKEKNPQFFMSMMDVPFSDEDFAVDHYEEQLRIKVLEPLHETYGIDISDKAILEAIRDHNEISRIITEIGDLRKAANPVITGYEFHVIQLVSQVCPHKRILPYLKQTLTELKRRKPDAQPWFRVRLVVTGSEIDDPAFTKLIEDCGAMVVADRYCYGSLPSREQIEILDGETPLRAVARHHQVIAITHLPQSAVYGARHLAVAKAVSGGRTRSTIQPLEGEARVAEIARMLGGTSLTSVVEQHARELLSRAQADAPNML